MGSSVSTAVQRSATRVSAPKAGTVAVAPRTTSAKPSSAPDASITARVRTQEARQQPSLYQRPSNEDWVATLNKMSGAITTSNWDNPQAAAAHHVHDKAHPAQRSTAVAERLPRDRARAGADGEQASRKPVGRLSQVDVLELFNLRRQQPQVWDAKTLCGKYNVDEGDVVDLLKFTRTYTARVDKDGQLRGYYNADGDNTIQRFEKD